MVLLVSQEKLNSLNIDTVERAIVLSALVLRMAIVGVDNSNFDNDKVRITTAERGINDIDLKLDISLPFSSYTFARNGGVLLSSISTFDTAITNLENQLSLTVNRSENITEAITQYPANLPSNFESYLYFYTSLLYASLSEKRNQFIRINPRGNGFDGSEVRLRITLPIDAKLWGLGKNLVECVQRISDVYLTENYYTDDSNTISNSIVNNSFLLGNNSLISNGNNQSNQSVLSNNYYVNNNALIGN